MKITHVKIHNILGIADLEFDAGQFTEMLGPNGHGKTSVLEAIKAAFGTGHDATLLRSGAEQGEVVLVLDDDTAIRRRVKASASDTQVRREGKIIPRPVETIRALIDTLSVNPVEFLRATKKDRARVLLESMPIKLDAQRLQKISGVDTSTFTASASPLSVIDAVRKTVYDDRTGTNRAVREKESTISQLTAATPEAPGGVDGDEDSLQAQIEAATDKRDAEHLRIDTKLAGLEAAHTGKIQLIRDALQAEIDRLRAAAQAEIDEATTQHQGVRDAAGRQRALTTQRWNDATSPLRAAKQSIAANRDAAVKRRLALETIATMGAELAELQKEAVAQTSAIDAIDAYKSELLGALPIKGLEVVDGEVIRNGVTFDRLNTAQQVQIAVEVSKLRAGPLGIVCVDGIELLNSAAYDEFKQQAMDSGLQMFVSRVTDDDGMSVLTTD